MKNLSDQVLSHHHQHTHKLVKTPFISSPIGAVGGFVGAKAIGFTDFWAIMALVFAGMVAAWFIGKELAEKFS